MLEEYDKVCMCVCMCACICAHMCRVHTMVRSTSLQFYTYICLNYEMSFISTSTTPPQAAVVLDEALQKDGSNPYTQFMAYKLAMAQGDNDKGELHLLLSKPNG